MKNPDAAEYQRMLDEMMAMAGPKAAETRDIYNEACARHVGRLYHRRIDPCIIATGTGRGWEQQQRQQHQHKKWRRQQRRIQPGGHHDYDDDHYDEFPNPYIVSTGSEISARMGRDSKRASGA